MSGAMGEVVWQRRLLAATLLASLAGFGRAQPHDHDPAPAPAQAEAAAPAAHEYAMTSAFGPYGMTRDASGTSWQPEATPPSGPMWQAGAWQLMAHALVNVVHDHQDGPRGDDQTLATSMAMLMAQRPALGGTLGLRAMVSLDPAFGRYGYPLLFGTGETADGVHPLVDRQHPHDAFMELSASQSFALGDDGAWFVYAGLPGEPALGPPSFMHRYSGLRNPEASLTHHWLDSTHITFGVVTLGASRGDWKLEASSFNGREPDQQRWNIETRSFDSWSTRLSYHPSPRWALQASYGDLDQPEQLEPDTGIRRTTVSVLHHHPLPQSELQLTLAWGRNDKRSPGEARKLDGYLLEAAWVRDRHTVFGRADEVENDELFDEADPLAGPAYRIRKLSLGYVYDVARTGPVTWGVGALASVYDKPAALDPAYGDDPRSWLLFLQGRL